MLGDEQPVSAGHAPNTALELFTTDYVFAAVGGRVSKRRGDTDNTKSINYGRHGNYYSSFNLHGVTSILLSRPYCGSQSMVASNRLPPISNPQCC
mgnify:CR=1 FL=1